MNHVLEAEEAVPLGGLKARRRSNAVEETMILATKTMVLLRLL